MVNTKHISNIVVVPKLWRMKRRLFNRLLFLIGFLSFFSSIVYAQDKHERRVYYLDCSASMTGSKSRPDDNIWDEVKLNLKEAIDAVTDETTELVVVPFANSCDFDPPLPLECKMVKATGLGKKDLKNYIDNIPTPDYSVNRTMTYHKIPLVDFVQFRIDKSKETYMFLMTDGDDEEKRKFGTETFNSMMKNWHHYIGVKDGSDISDVYGIYVMLNSKYNNKSREELIRKTDYFWQFNTANVNIKRIKLSTDIVYNIRNEKTIAINIDGNTQEGLTFDLFAPYDAPFEIKETTIQGDKLIVQILPKENVDVHSLDESKVYTIVVKMSGADDITLLATEKIKLECLSKRENSVTVTHSLSAKTQSKSIWDDIKSMLGVDVDRSASFGTVHYYPSFLWFSDSIAPVVDSIYFNFSKDAQLNSKLYAEFQFVDNEGEPYKGDVLKIFDGENLLRDNILKISNSDYAKGLKFVFSPDAETGKHQGYFRLVNHNLLHRIDHYFLDCLESKVLTDNKNDKDNQVNIFQWTLHYEKHLNPLLKNILWGVFLLFVILIATIILNGLMWMFGPKFPLNWDIKFESNIINTPTVTFECPNEKDYRLKGLRIFTHAANVFYSRRLFGFRINKVVLCNKTYKTWSYFKGYSIYIKTNFNNNDTTNNITSLTITPSTKGMLANIKVKYSDKSCKEGELNHHKCNDETNRISIDYINVDIFGKKHNN